ncbi:paraquat-inducible protein A [Nitrospira lenta]|uniref:Paraquat-inducible protein A n=1 Tax=Nitrospira lenta TaxID=1436998 RepID=A0A330L1C4_9BACT|nr:paraquat-inducible protein A [Nitrospira lenta]SPP63013.1 Paraquat-inducible protein A [Nitrospira lenta]
MVGHARVTSATLAQTAARRGLLSCPLCSLLTQAEPMNGGSRCARCGTPLHFRKPNSISRTWALLLTSYILFIPANLLPIMHTNSLFGTQSDTIASGIVYFWASGDWHLAIIVFIASLLIPTAKLAILTFLVVSVQRRSTWDPLQRTNMYRVIELVGRWSMLDVFVVAISVALVHLHSLATIHAGAGAVAFGAVVITTMLATMTFDPRLIWDPYWTRDHE